MDGGRLETQPGARSLRRRRRRRRRPARKTLSAEPTSATTAYRMCHRHHHDHHDCYCILLITTPLSKTFTKVVARRTAEQADLRPRARLRHHSRLTSRPRLPPPRQACGDQHSTGARVRPGGCPSAAAGERVHRWPLPPPHSLIPAPCSLKLPLGTRLRSPRQAWAARYKRSSLSGIRIVHRP